VTSSNPVEISAQPFVIKGVNSIESQRRNNMNSGSRKLYRSRTNRLIFGVCGGLGEFFGIDVTIVRLIFVIGALLGFGSFVLIYLVMFFVVPEEP
jgi:phage shock protein C